MKSLIKLYAKYNKDTNEKIVKILSGLSRNELMLERNTYFKSINGLFNHLIVSGWYLLNAIRSIAGMSYPNNEESTEVLKRAETSFKEASQIMMEMDKDLIKVIDKLTDKELEAERKKNRIYNGSVVNITVSEFITQHIIHQTHHRGQLSQILDELKIDNDFGSIFPYVKDSEEKL